MHTRTIRTKSSSILYKQTVRNIFATTLKYFVRNKRNTSNDEIFKLVLKCIVFEFLLKRCSNHNIILYEKYEIFYKYHIIIISSKGSIFLICD